MLWLSSSSFRQAPPQAILLHSTRGGKSQRIKSHYHQGCGDYVIAFFTIYLSWLSRSMIALTRGVLNFVCLAKFILNDIRLKLAKRLCCYLCNLQEETLLYLC